MRILYAQVDAKLARSATTAFRSNLLAVDTIDVTHLLDLAIRTDYYAIVLDLNQSSEGGVSLLRRMREVGIRAPIIAFNGCHSASDRIRLLEAGADDCLSDPVSLEELVVRTRVLGRGSGRSVSKLRVRDLELDHANRLVTRGGKRIHLKPKEFAILEYLMRNAGRPVTRSMIVEHVWNGHFEGLTNVVDVHINHLRANIDRGFSVKLVRTAYGIGYELGDPQ